MLKLSAFWLFLTRMDPYSVVTGENGRATAGYGWKIHPHLREWTTGLYEGAKNMRVLPWVFSGLMVLGLAACGDKAKNQSETTPPPATSNPPEPSGTTAPPATPAPTTPPADSTTTPPADSTTTTPPTEGATPPAEGTTTTPPQSGTSN
jgi:hypothetical protein